MTFPLLSLLIWLSIIGGIPLLFVGHKIKHETQWTRYWALAISLLCLVLCVPLLQGFDSTSFAMQWQEKASWIPNLGIQYALGVDGFSVPLIILTCFMTVLVVLASFHSVKENVDSYLAAFLIMQGLIVGALSAQDGILFYTFWEGMLIPMFLIIGIWGGKNRIYATIKFFLYTFLGSVLFLVALIYLHLRAKELAIPLQDSFSIQTFQHLPLTFDMQKWLFIAFLVAFAVKVPMWPVHTWLPDAHVEAPTGGSVILAAILLKMGGYGFLRFMLPIAPDASMAFAVPMIVLSLIAIVYIGFVAIVQQDMKKLIAYSSVSHMGFVTLGFFVVFGIVMHSTAAGSAASGIEGAMVQMISHGFVSAALFLCVGVLYDRLHSRLIKDYGGVVNSMPVFASFFMLFAMANVGLPGTSGFVGEFLVILSAYKANVWYALIATSILLLGASYTLWMYKRVIFGATTRASITGLVDLSFSEKLIFLLLAIAVLWLGLWPAPLLDLMHASSNHLIEQMISSKL
jgi:NADH-quinone oxidoreductase subunit M